MNKVILFGLLVLATVSIAAPQGKPDWSDYDWSAWKDGEKPALDGEKPDLDEEKPDWDGGKLMDWWGGKKLELEDLEKPDLDGEKPDWPKWDDCYDDDEDDMEEGDASSSEEEEKPDWPKWDDCYDD